MNQVDEKNDAGVSGIDDFDKLLDLVRVDTNLINNLTDEQVTSLRKKLNPYGRTIEGSGSFTCLSITNLSEQYMKKFLMTSLIGFLYRQCDEYELDDGEPPCYLDDYDTFMSMYTKALNAAAESKVWLANFNADGLEEDTLTMEQKADRLTHTRAVERGEGFMRRLVVRQFLDSQFQFNPDKHVRSAYSSNPLDTEREVPTQFKEADKKPVSVKSSKSNSNKEVSRSDSKFVKHVPPADVFHRWAYYTDSNYEEVRTAVQDLYADKPDLEFAINPYDKFNSQEDADKFIQKHKNEVIADVLTLTNGKWNLTGSFKKNRERINFYNEKTAVLEEIFKQLEQDKKLGADLMRKRVKRKKDKNVKESGTDPALFTQYRKEHVSGFESMGAEDLSKSTKSTSKSSVVHEDCPYDAVQVDVFDMRKGGQIVNKSEFFTQSEDPLQNTDARR